MKVQNLALLLLLAASVPAGTEAAAQEEAVRPLTFEAGYTVDGYSNVSGGISQGTRFLDNFDVTLTADLEALAGWKGATVFLYGLGNQGKSPSDLIGDAQGVSNIDAPTSWRLYEAWIEQNFHDDRLSFKAGLYDLNSEFDAIEAAGLFINSSHGIGPDFAQTGLNGPSIFPITSLGLRARIALSDALSIQAVVLDGVPGDPDDPTGTKISLNKEDGALVVGEVGYAFDSDYGWLPSEGRLALGGYFYTRDFECILPPELMDHSLTKAQAAGFYLLAEGRVYGEPGSDDQGANAFMRFGSADHRISQFGTYLGAGVVYSGFFPGRDGDQLGLAVASAVNGAAFRRLQGFEGAPVDRAEVAVELTYQAEVLSGFVLQPDIQYIVNPGTDRSLGNALAIGVRAGVSF